MDRGKFIQVLGVDLHGHQADLMYQGIHIKYNLGKNMGTQFGQ
jgi:hypothetical protein